MSIGAQAIGEVPIAALVDTSDKKSSPPPKRTIIPMVDTVAQPEPR